MDLLLLRRTMMSQGVTYIVFADSNVEALCKSNWGSANGVTLSQAKRVTSFGTVFKGDTTIIAFDEAAEFGLTTIPDEAFQGCTALTTIDFPDTVTTVGQSAFDGCSLLAIEVDLPNITSLGNLAFMNSGITKVVDLGSVTTINGADGQGGTFSGCTDLTEVVLPSTVTNIGSYAFQGCTSLTTINFPSSITTISGRAFWNCSSLTGDLSIPGLTTIYGGAFSGTAIQRVLNLGSVTNLNHLSFPNWLGVFEGCTSLTSVVLPNTLTIIGSSCFKNCTSLSTINFPSSLEKIQSYAFNNCDSLTSVNLSGVNSLILESDVFRDCSYLTTVSLPTNTTSLPQSLFEGCNRLTTVTSLSNITTLNSYCFSGCSAFAVNISLPSLTTIGSGVFTNSGITGISNLGSITSIPDGYIAYYGTFAFCNSLTAATLPSTLTSIGDGAFRECSRLTNINFSSFENNITRIGTRAFVGCPITAEINFPSLTSIGLGAFSNTSITKILNLGSITELPTDNNYPGTFNDCAYLTEVTLPSTLTTIGKRSFYNDVSLTKVTCNATTPPTLGDDVFGNCPLTEINVPAASVSAYQNASGWSNYSNIIQAIN